MCRYILVICIVSLLTASSQAQFRDSVKDAKVVVDTGHFQMKKSPTLALVLSGILPGAGQIYTGGWYKAPFIMAGIAGCFIGAYIQNGRYHVDIDSVNNQLARGDQFNANRYTAQREFYRDDRDRWYIYAALVYLTNLLDAYISAHLYDFDVSDPTNTAYIEAPKTHEESWRIGMRVRF